MKGIKEQRTHYCFRQEAGSDVHKLYIYDDVSEHGELDWWTWEYTESETSAEFFRKALAEIPDSAVIELHINSYGGDVKEGVAIYNQMKQKKCKEIVAYVDGFAYSIASVIMQAADRRVMGLGTSLLIHNMWAYVAGNADELRKAADDLDVLMESNRQIYMERVNITEEELIRMLDNETYLTPEQAVEMGFADEVAGNVTAAPDLTQQLQQQLAQMRREMAARKAFREEMKEFCGPGRQKGDEKDSTDSEEADSGADAGEEDGDADSTGEEHEDTGGTDEDDSKKQKLPKQHRLAELIGQAAAKYLKERE